MKGNDMNRIVTMVLKNLWHVPGAWFKLCHYAKNTDKYPELEQWQHIQYILKLAVTSGNIDFECHGVENIPKEKVRELTMQHIKDIENGQRDFRF